MGMNHQINTEDLGEVQTLLASSSGKGHSKRVIAVSNYATGIIVFRVFSNGSLLEVTEDLKEAISIYNSLP